jgi:sarcosine oxidase, subunit gamma
MPSSVVLDADARRRPLAERVLPSSESFLVRPAPDAARFILRAGAEAAAHAGGAFGASPPARPCRAVTAGTRTSIWLGPDEWLLIAPGEDAAPLAAVLAAALADGPHSLVDVSQRQIGLEVEGVLAARALNAGCPLDLGLAAFPVGMATRTLCAKCEIVLWRRSAVRFHLEVWRSYAEYAANFLVEAARRAPRNPAAPRTGR